MNMIEKVARAICVSMESSPMHWRIYEDEAKAAIEAMRDPSNSVEKAIVDCCNLMPGGGDGKRAWEAAIDVALEERN